MSIDEAYSRVPDFRFVAFAPLSEAARPVDLCSAKVDPIVKSLN
jgi:hypothetical protein